MLSEIIHNLSSTSGLPAFFAVTALILGGIVLIGTSRRTREDEIARRVDMVRPVLAAVPDSGDEHAFLFRVPTQSMSEGAQREIMRFFGRFGVAGKRALSLFVVLRLAVVALLAVLVFVWGRTVPAFHAVPMLPFPMAAMAAIIGWFVPMMFVSYAVKQRSKAVRSGLPDALELLVVCVEAGLSLEDGLGRVVDELGRSQPALADELALTLADLKILPSRDQALANLAARVDLPSVRSVVTTLAQTLRYGTPLAQALRVVAAEMRNDYMIEMEERANRLPAFMTLPVILFLMPTIFIIVGGPAALRLLDSFHF